MVKVGIDSLAFYTSRYALALTTLAQARNIDPDKFTNGLGQLMMSVPPPGEDIVTMGANAALQLFSQQLTEHTISTIDMLLFATESGIDQSKSAGLYLHNLLKLPTHCRVVELKQACYSATAAIQLAMPYLRENPTRKVLLIAADIARYGLCTPGESSQGSGAVAMLLSAHPRLIAFDRESGVVAEDVMDFWRPNYLHEALVEGKYSSKLYLSLLEACWEKYQALSQRSLVDHDLFCYHTPVPRLVEKAHQHLLKLNHIEASSAWSQSLAETLYYGRHIGNSYTASLYVSLISMLDRLCDHDLAGKRIGFYSYGSGCVGEYFSGVIQPEYQTVLQPAFHQNLLDTRALLDYPEYEAFYQFHYSESGDTQEIPVYQTGAFRLARMQMHKRIYERTMTTHDHTNSMAKSTAATLQSLASVT